MQSNGLYKVIKQTATACQIEAEWKYVFRFLDFISSSCSEKDTKCTSFSIMDLSTRSNWSTLSHACGFQGASAKEGAAMGGNRHTREGTPPQKKTQWGSFVQLFSHFSTNPQVPPITITRKERGRESVCVLGSRGSVCVLGSRGLVCVCAHAWLLVCIYDT